MLQAIGVELDLADKGLGIRSRRYAMLLDDGAVSALSPVYACVATVPLPHLKTVPSILSNQFSLSYNFRPF